MPDRPAVPPMDYPEAWEFVRSTDPDDHHPRCSWRTENGALLCDCDVLWDEYVRRGGPDLSRLREQVKFCPYCAGAFVPETKGYEGPCAGCKRAESAEARCARLQQALAKADKAASKSHDAMWAMDFDKTSASSLERDEWKRLRERASKAVWEIHNLLRPLIDAGEALAGAGSEQSSLTESGSAGLPDTPADSQEPRDESGYPGLQGLEALADSQEDKT